MTRIVIGMTRGMVAMLALASKANMPALSMRLAGKLAQENQRYDGALYPIPPYKPTQGFEIDPALVYAVMRQESAFNSKALSRAGARGLMQLGENLAGSHVGRHSTFRHIPGYFGPVARSLARLPIAAD